jgi:hypothetical protein
MKTVRYLTIFMDSEIEKSEIIARLNLYFILII